MSIRNDMISRLEAIDAILCQPPEPHYPSWYADIIKALSPAQQNKTCEFWDSESSFCGLNRPSAQRKGKWKGEEDEHQERHDNKDDI